MTLSTDFYPGGYDLSDIILTSSKGTTIDLSLLFSEMHVYEDIFANFITGSITIKDAVGIYDNFPIMGQEEISFHFASKASSASVSDKIGFDVDCQIYKIGDVRLNGFRTKIYTLYFASKEVQIDLNNKVSMSFQSVKGSDIVKSLLTNPIPNGLGYSGESIIQESLIDENLVIPYWTPMQTINYITSRTVADNNQNAANFIFYQNRTGYNFVTLESLARQNANVTYTYDNQTTGPINLSSIYTISTINNYHIDSGFNIMEHIASGTLGSTLHTFDPVMKNMQTFTHTYDASFNSIETLDKNPLLSSKTQNSTNSSIKYYPTSYNAFGNNQPNNNITPEKWLQQRTTQLNMWNQLRIIVDSYGNTGVQAGDVVNCSIKITDPSENDGSTIQSQYYTGKYLISAIHHILTPRIYTQTMEFLKDSLPTAYN